MGHDRCWEWWWWSWWWSCWWCWRCSCSGRCWWCWGGGVASSSGNGRDGVSLLTEGEKRRKKTLHNKDLVPLTQFVKNFQRSAVTSAKSAKNKNGFMYNRSPNSSVQFWRRGRATQRIFRNDPSWVAIRLDWLNEVDNAENHENLVKEVVRSETTWFKMFRLFINSSTDRKIPLTFESKLITCRKRRSNRECFQMKEFLKRCGERLESGLWEENTKNERKHAKHRRSQISNRERYHGKTWTNAFEEKLAPWKNGS